MKQYQYLLFDWDGCLAQTLPIWLDAYKVVYAAAGVFPTDQEITFHFGDWEAPKYYGLDVKKTFEKIDARAQKALEKAALYEGAYDLLHKLRPIKKLALLSSSEKITLEYGLKHNKLDNFFDVVISGDEVQNHKPHPEVIKKGLAALGGKEDMAIMIGDSRKDLEAAQNAGIDSVLVYPPENKVFYNLDELKKYQPTYTVFSFNELEKILIP